MLDGYLVERVISVGVVCDQMQMACRIIERWCEGTGLSVNPRKTEMILYTRRRKPTHYGRPLTRVTRVKYLVITLDDKLSWKPHLDLVVNKVIATFWQLRRVVRAT